MFCRALQFVFLTCFFLHAGCQSVAAAKPEFDLLTGELGDALTIVGHNGFLQIDGHTTTVKWLRYPPKVHRVSKNLFVLNDHYSGEREHLYLWNGKTNLLKKLTGDLYPIGKDHCIIIQNYSVAKRRAPRILDIDPETAQLRELWRGSPGEGVISLGKEDQKLFFIVGQASSQSILTVLPSEAASETTVELDQFRARPTGDSVRGKHVLLIRRKKLAVPETGPEDTTSRRQFQVPPVYEVGCFDMISKTIRVLGDIEGGWMLRGGDPTPMVNLEWLTKEKAGVIALGQQTLFCPAHYVVVGTLELISPNKK